MKDVARSGKAQQKAHNRLMAAAERLQVPIVNIPAGIKSRLVVHAQSSYNESTEAVADTHLTVLISEARKLTDGGSDDENAKQHFI